MKKFLLVLICTWSVSLYTLAQQIISFSTELVKNKPIGHGSIKSPILPPTVYLDDRTLTFTADHPEYVLSVRNEEDEVVYTTVVSPSQTQVALPSTLSGEYQIQLTLSSWMFTGWITL